MTNKATLERTIEVLNTNAYVGTYFECDDLKNICEALTKQIPKKAIKDECLERCPECLTPIISESDVYCYNCGQAIDWSGEE